MTVVQCWDDGVTTDVRLAEILRRHGAKATFNLNAGLHAAERKAGHVYARTTGSVEQPFPPGNPMAFHPCCHFLVPDLWSRYEKAKTGGVFYFWGHSYELITEAMWTAFENMIVRISNDPMARWGEVADLFDDTMQNKIAPNKPDAGGV